MKGTWDRLSPALIVPSAKGRIVSKAILFSQKWDDLCRLCYDAETPEVVVHELKIHPDASVRSAAMQRKAVLNHDLRNPFC